MIRTNLAAILLTAGTAAAQQTTLTVDSAMSPIDIEACVDAGTGLICEFGSTTFSGTVTIDVDDPASPTTASIVGLDLVTTGAVTLNYSFGFLGSVTVTGDSFTVTYAGTEPTPPASLGSGSPSSFFFEALAVPVTGRLVGTFSSSGLIGVTVGSGDLDVESPDTPDIDAGLSIDPTTGDYTLQLDFAAVQEGELNGVNTVVTGITTVVARGPAPEPAPDCLADINGDDAVTGVDFTDFISAFGAGDLSIDQNGDGVITGVDFTDFITNFGLGCPTS